MARGKKSEVDKENLDLIEEVIEEPKVQENEPPILSIPTFDGECKEHLLYNGCYYAPGDLVEITEEEVYHRLLDSNVIE